MLCITVIWILCLAPIPETPISHVRFIDKWTHLVMYGGLCTVIWLELGWHNRASIHTKTVMCAFVMPVLMGGAIELAQAYCTGGNRSGEWMDFVADTAGVVIGQVTGILPARYLANRRKGS